MKTDLDEKFGDELKDNRLEENSSASSLSDLDHDNVYSLQEQKAIVHRIDRRLVATCGLIYCFSLIDRGNLGNASIAG